MATLYNFPPLPRLPGTQKSMPLVRLGPGGQTEIIELML